MGARACHSDDSRGLAESELSYQGIATAAADLRPQVLTRLDRITAALEHFVDEGRRIADHIALAPGDTASAWKAQIASRTFQPSIQDEAKAFGKTRRRGAAANAHSAAERRPPSPEPGGAICNS